MSLDDAIFVIKNELQEEKSQNLVHQYFKEFIIEKSVHFHQSALSENSSISSYVPSSLSNHSPVVSPEEPLRKNCFKKTFIFILLVFFSVLMLLLGIGLIIFGAVNQSIYGFIFGGLAIVLSLFSLLCILVIYLIKDKKIVYPLCQKGDAHVIFFEKKQTTFERNYFNNTVLSYEKI